MATIKNKGNGTFLITIYDGYRPDGSQKRIYRTFHANLNSSESAQMKQAEKYAGRLETECEDKRVTDHKKISFQKVYDDYIDDLTVIRKLAPQTIDSYKKLFEGRLLKEFGKMPVRNIDTSDIDRFIRKLAKSGKDGKLLSGTYCLKYFQQLNELFRYAQRKKYIVANPCDTAEKPKIDTQEAQYYELPEVAKIVNLLDKYSDPEWKAYFCLAFYCGCRPGELIGLNWSDYDGSCIFVKAGSYQRKGEKTKRTDKPKTKKSNRRILLTDEAAAALDSWRKAQAVHRLKLGECWQDPEAVFTNEYGERISSTTPPGVWKRFTTENKLRHLPPYDLRHTNCSLLIASRELSVEEVAARMGHEQTSTTLNIYSHAFANSNARATQALTNVLAQAEAK